MTTRRAAQPDFSSARTRAQIAFGVALAVGIWLVVVALAEPYDWARLGTGHDARPYWTAAFGSPYLTSRVGAHDAYLYSPSFLELIAPLRAIPWQAFLAIWTAILILATLYMVGPVLLAPALIMALPELLGGNITLLLAAALVAGFRYPGAWAFPILTKVTPGVGVLWFAVRREWRSVAIAAATTIAVIVFSTFFTRASIWMDWIRVLGSNAGAAVESGSLPVPFLLRLPLAVGVIAFGARANLRWLLPIGCLLAFPVIWYGSLTMLLACIPLAFPEWTRWPYRELFERLRQSVRQRNGAGWRQSA